MCNLGVTKVENQSRLKSFDLQHTCTIVQYYLEMEDRFSQSVLGFLQNHTAYINI